MCADVLSIDCGLLPWQSVVTLGQQTSYFYKGDQVHCSAGLHFPELRTALRFLFFMRRNGISHSVVKAESRELDTDVYASQIYCQMQLCQEIPPLWGWWSVGSDFSFLKNVLKTGVQTHRNAGPGCSCELTSDAVVLLQSVVLYNKDLCSVSHSTSEKQRGSNSKTQMRVFCKGCRTVYKHHHILAVNQRGNPVFKAL